MAHRKIGQGNDWSRRLPYSCSGVSTPSGDSQSDFTQVTSTYDQASTSGPARPSRTRAACAVGDQTTHFRGRAFYEISIVTSAFISVVSIEKWMVHRKIGQVSNWSPPRQARAISLSLSLSLSFSLCLSLSHTHYPPYSCSLRLLCMDEVLDGPASGERAPSVEISSTVLE